MKSSTFTPLLLAVAVLAGCGKKTVEPDAPTTGSFALELESVVGTAPLTLNVPVYSKADGQTFTVSKFKYLVSNVKLSRADGTAYAVPDGYYLIDAAKPTSAHIVIDKVPLGDYTGLSFMVGVDAAHNNATFQAGDLNRANDLYWEWSQEYVFLKMAGTSAQAPAGRGLTFDIGGATIARTVAQSFRGQVLGLKVGHTPQVHIEADVTALFESVVPANNINFATTYSVESGSPWAPIIADNYAASMFSFEHIHDN